MMIQTAPLSHPTLSFSGIPSVREITEKILQAKSPVTQNGVRISGGLDCFIQEDKADSNGFSISLDPCSKKSNGQRLPAVPKQAENSEAIKLWKKFWGY